MKLAENNSWELDFISKNENGNALTWDDSLSMLASGDLDIMGCMLLSEERAQQYDFPSLAAGQVFTSLFVRNDSSLTSNDFRGLNKIVIAANTATMNDEDVTAFAEVSGFEIGAILDCEEIQGVIDAVLNGTADAGVMASYQPVENTRIIASFSPRPFYFATTKGNTAVLSALNQGMNSILIQNPYYSQNLSEKYSQINSGQVSFTEQEQEYIAKTDPIRVCYSDAWFPLIQAGNDPMAPVSVIPDILSEISSNSGLQFEYFHVATHAEVLEDSASGQCDMIAICIYDLQHAQNYHIRMTDSYLQMQLVMVSNGKIPTSNTTIGTMADFPLFNEADSENNHTVYKYYFTVRDCFEALRKGEVDSIIVGSYTANYFLALSRYSGFLRTNLQGQYAPISMAVSERYPDKPLLLSVLNKAIGNLSSAEVNRIMVDNTMRDGSGLEAVVNRIPSTVIIMVLLFFIMISILIASLSGALIRKSRLAKKQAEEQKATAEKDAQLLRIDELTGLYNERGFEDAVRQKLDDYPNKSWFLLDFDVVGFKYINALYGKEQSDQLLIMLTRILIEDLQPDEIGGRIYGDHFTALFTGKNLSEIKTRILSANEKFKKITDRYLILMSYGIYPISDPNMPVSILCDHAQVAKRKVKGNYNDFIAVYDDDMDQRQKENIALIMSFDAAISDKEFQAFYQPQYDMKTEKIIGAEALVRWKHGNQLIMPDHFISLFESNGLIETLDFYMLETVCAHLKGQIAAGLTPVPISVNFSKSHLYDQMFLSKLEQIITDAQVPASLLVAEFTEYTYLWKESALRSIISELHKIGVRVSLDDFGSGYSSLNMLSSIDFDEIKLDKGFLKESPLSVKSQKLIRLILQFISGQSIHTVAEGVETKEQLTFLRENGCDTAQGYFFSRPVSGEAYDRLLLQQKG